MKLIILDAYSINPGDLSWAPIEALGDFHTFDRTANEDIVSRSQEPGGAGGLPALLRRFLRQQVLHYQRSDGKVPQFKIYRRHRNGL